MYEGRTRVWRQLVKFTSPAPHVRGPDPSLPATPPARRRAGRGGRAVRAAGSCPPPPRRCLRGCRSAGPSAPRCAPTERAPRASRLALERLDQIEEHTGGLAQRDVPLGRALDAGQPVAVL